MGRTINCLCGRKHEVRETITEDEVKRICEEDGKEIMGQGKMISIKTLYEELGMK